MHRRLRSSAALLSALAGVANLPVVLPGTALAQMRLPPCPVIVSPADPGYCQSLPVPLQAEDLRGDLAPTDPLDGGRALLTYQADDGTYLLTRRPLFAPGDISLLSRRSGPEIPGSDQYKIGAYSEAGTAQQTAEATSAYQPAPYQSTYDLPLFDGLALSNSSSVSQTGYSDNENKSASSKFGLAYQDYGITFRVDPDAAANWSDLAGSGSRRFGVDNSASALIARDLTLTLSSGYTSESSPGNPMAASSNERHRLALAQHFASGYKLGVSGQRRNEYRYQEERDLNILGLQIGVPLSDSLNLTANHEFGLGEKRALNTSNALPLYGHQQMLDLQLQWTPAALASRAMTLMAGYTVTQDDMAGTADPYLSQARLNLAMRF